MPDLKRQAKIMHKQYETYIHSFDNTRLFIQRWEPETVKGTLFITHGQGEHSDCYSRLIDSLRDTSWRIIAWDLRGHGRSDGKRGYAESFDHYCQDFMFVLKHLEAEQQIQYPLALFAHSMGGLIQLKSLIKNPSLKHNALVFSSPFLGLSLPVPTYKSYAAGVLNKWLPQVTMGNEITYDMLTSDLEVIRSFEKDPLRTNKISPAVFLGFLESFEWLKPRANEIKSPTFFALSKNDSIVSTPVSLEFFKSIGSLDKKCEVYDGKHELINDFTSPKVCDDIKTFLNKFVENT